MNPDESLSALVALSEDELLERIGESLEKDSLHIGPRSSRALIKKAKRWLQNQRPTLQDHICRNKRIRDLAQGSDHLVLAGAIADLLSSFLIKVSPFTLAALIVKRGVETLCAETWELGKKEG